MTFFKCSTLCTNVAWRAGLCPAFPVHVCRLLEVFGAVPDAVGQAGRHLARVQGSGGASGLEASAGLTESAPLDLSGELSSLLSCEHSAMSTADAPAPPLRSTAQVATTNPAWRNNALAADEDIEATVAFAVAPTPTPPAPAPAAAPLVTSGSVTARHMPPAPDAADEPVAAAAAAEAAAVDPRWLDTAASDRNLNVLTGGGGGDASPAGSKMDSMTSDLALNVFASKRRKKAAADGAAAADPRWLDSSVSGISGPLNVLAAAGGQSSMMSEAPTAKLGGGLSSMSEHMARLGGPSSMMSEGLSKLGGGASSMMSETPAAGLVWHDNAAAAADAPVAWQPNAAAAAAAPAAAPAPAAASPSWLQNAAADAASGPLGDTSRLDQSSMMLGQASAMSGMSLLDGAPSRRRAALASVSMLEEDEPTAMLVDEDSRGLASTSVLDASMAIGMRTQGTARGGTSVLGASMLMGSFGTTPEPSALSGLIMNSANGPQMSPRLAQSPLPRPANPASGPYVPPSRGHSASGVRLSAVTEAAGGGSTMTIAASDAVRPSEVTEAAGGGSTVLMSTAGLPPRQGSTAGASRLLDASVLLATAGSDDDSANDI